MIKLVEGDILLTKAAAIAHGVAPNDDFKHGLALALRERWPGMYKDFRHYCQTLHPREGGIWSWAGPGAPRIIALFTQSSQGHGAHPGPATASNVSHCLKALRKECAKEHLASLALPRLATGVGGLDWRQVEPLIREHLGELAISVLVYASYRPGLGADEA